MLSLSIRFLCSSFLLLTGVTTAFIPFPPLSPARARARTAGITSSSSTTQQHYRRNKSNGWGEHGADEQQLDEWLEHQQANIVAANLNHPAAVVPKPIWNHPVTLDENVCQETGVTLSRYMLAMARANPELEDIESIMTALQTACKTISSLIRRSSLRGLTGLYQVDGDEAAVINAQGEEQKKLDVMTNEVLKKALQWSGKLGTLASEEEELPIILDNSGRNIVVEETGGYVAVFDPLDGSSNVDSNIPTGTIFGIFARNDECRILDGCLMDTMQPGKNLVAAGYCLYSSATTLVFTLGAGVFGFTLDESIGEFRLTHPNMRIPARGKTYSFNEGNRWDWDQPLQNYLADIQQARGETGMRYTARYVGSMVSDVHRTLLNGGIFGYPADKKNPNGKLRLLYEAAPMAFLVEQAGGMALADKNRIMDIHPKSVHQRVPCILGSPEDVSELRRYYEVANTDPDLTSTESSGTLPKAKSLTTF